MTEVGLKEDNTTNRAAWRNNIISYAGDPMTGQAREEDEEETALEDAALLLPSGGN